MCTVCAQTTRPSVESERARAWAPCFCPTFEESTASKRVWPFGAQSTATRCARATVLRCSTEHYFLSSKYKVPAGCDSKTNFCVVCVAEVLRGNRTRASFVLLCRPHPRVLEGKESHQGWMTNERAAGAHFTLFLWLNASIYLQMAGRHGLRRLHFRRRGNGNE